MKNNIVETMKEELVYINLTMSEEMEKYLAYNILYPMEEPLLYQGVEYLTDDLLECYEETKEDIKLNHPSLLEEFESIIKEMKKLSEGEFFYINETRGKVIEEVKQ